MSKGHASYGGSMDLILTLFREKKRPLSLQFISYQIALTTEECRFFLMALENLGMVQQSASEEWSLRNEN